MLKELSEKTMERKTKRFDNLWGLILNEIGWDSDLGFCTLSEYKQGVDCFENGLVKYAFSEEEIWSTLFSICGVDDEIDLFNSFLNARFCEHENLMLVELLDKKICVLRL